MKKILLLGLGNEIRGDDGIGIVVTRKIRENLQNSDFIDIKDTEEMGLSLLDFISGYEELILIDSVQTKKVLPGTIHELDEKDLKSLRGLPPHFVGISETIAIGKTLGIKIPSKIKIFAIEVKDPYTITTTITNDLSKKVPYIVTKISQYIQHIIKNYEAIN